MSVDRSTATITSVVTQFGSNESDVNTDWRQRGRSFSSLRAGIRTLTCHGSVIICGPTDLCEIRHGVQSARGSDYPDGSKSHAPSLHATDGPRNDQASELLTVR